MSDPGVAPASRQATATDADLRPVDKRWIALFALSWFGVWIAQLTPIQLLLPAQVTQVLDLDPQAWVRNVVAFGLVSGIAGVAVWWDHLAGLRGRLRASDAGRGVAGVRPAAADLWGVRARVLDLAAGAS